MPKRLSALMRDAKDRLETAGVETALLDVRLLLQAAMPITHAEMIADPDQMISETQVAAFEILLKRRLAREPVSRILGEREFYGRVFQISSDVLDPRADTETLIEAAAGLKPQRILDLGVGSGAIIVTLLAEHPDATGVAVDVSQAALKITQDNAKRHGVDGRMTFVQSSWFENVEGTFDLIVSNPPYIPYTDILELDIDVKDHDPHLALDGGADGLDCYRTIAQGVVAHLTLQGKVLVEIGAGQARDVTAIFTEIGLKTWVEAPDLSGKIRILGFQN